LIGFAGAWMMQKAERPSVVRWAGAAICLASIGLLFA
jgi:hypothetical protein